jgi:hypothetical protein
VTTEPQISHQKVNRAARRAFRDALVREPSALQGIHEFAALAPEDKLRAVASLARFVQENRGRVASPRPLR